MPWKKRIAIISSIIVVLILSLISACLFLGIHSKMDAIGYLSMIHEDFHPIWKDLALRKIQKGDSLEILLNKHTPIRREDFIPYTYLYYELPFKSLSVVAKNGKLIYAVAGSCTWEHTFFETPEENEKLNEAYSKGIKQLSLESNAYKIHLAATNGQDVFISQHIKHFEVPKEQQSEKYGIPTKFLNNLEITTEVSEVIFGDLKPGTILKFPGVDCIDSDPNKPETVFIHVDDFKLLYPIYSRNYELYITVPKEALEFYKALTDEQKNAFVAKLEQRKEDILKRYEKARQ